MRMSRVGPVGIGSTIRGIIRLNGFLLCCFTKLNALGEHSVKWSQKAELLFAKPFHPADALHMLQQGSQTFLIMNVYLPKERRITIEREMRKSGQQEILPKDEFLDR